MLDEFKTPIVGAYGRDYANTADAQADFSDGQDFKICATGQYISKRNFVKGERVECRSRNLRLLFMLTA